MVIGNRLIMQSSANNLDFLSVAHNETAYLASKCTGFSNYLSAFLALFIALGIAFLI
jgi:hypothetical protein